MWNRAREIKTAEAQKEERDSEGQKNNNEKQPKKENIEIIISEYFNEPCLEQNQISKRFESYNMNSQSRPTPTPELFGCGRPLFKI